MLDESGNFTEDFKQALPDMLGDNYYNDPDTKQQPTKMFDDVPDLKTLTNNYANAQRKISSFGKEMEEKLKGTVRIPTEKSSPEEIAAYRKAVGVPESPDKYELKLPEGEDEGYKAIADIVRTIGHKHGVPGNILSLIWDGVVPALNAQVQALENKGLEILKAEEEALKEEWKEKHDENIKAGDDALAKTKTGPEFMKLMETFGIQNHPAIRKLLHEISPLINEGKTVLGAGVAAEKKEWFTDYAEVGKSEEL